MNRESRDIETLIKEYDNTVSKGKTRINRIYVKDIHDMYIYTLEELGIESHTLADREEYSVIIHCIINSIKYGVMLEKHTTKK